MFLKVGDKVLVFIFNLDELKFVFLSDYSGKNVVLLFFLMVFISVCIIELCIMWDDIVIYNGFDVEIVVLFVDFFFILGCFK